MLDLSPVSMTSPTEIGETLDWPVPKCVNQFGFVKGINKLEEGMVVSQKDGVVTLRSIGEKGSHTHALIDLLLDPPQNI